MTETTTTTTTTTSAETTKEAMTTSKSSTTDDHDHTNTPAPTTTTTTPSHRLLRKLEQEMEELAIQYGMNDKDGNVDQRRRRHTLQLRHIQDFSNTDTLFDEFARTVCTTDVIPRKELFEAWAMATYVHNYFPSHMTTRIADLACSHGLLSWALLLMAKSSSSEVSDDENGKEIKQQQRSVICIDKTMPRSSERIQLGMIEQYPKLTNSWDYVEGSLEGVIPSSSTLLVGVHCCGILSDKVIDLAIQGLCPMALVPCCHSKNCLSLPQRKLLEIKIREKNQQDNDDNENNQQQEQEEEDNQDTNNKKRRLGKDDSSATSTRTYIDQLRIERLHQAGFTTDIAHIPLAFTPKNTIIFAMPPPSPPKSTMASSSEMKEEVDKVSKISPEVWQMKKLFCIPVADHPIARATVKSLAGRAAANQRNEPPPRNLSLSLELPHKDYVIPLDQLQALVYQVIATTEITYPPPKRSKKSKKRHKNQNQQEQPPPPQKRKQLPPPPKIPIPIPTIEVAVDHLHDSHRLLKDGNYGRTFQISYRHGKTKNTGVSITEDGGGTRNPMSKEVAKQIHLQLCYEVPKEFPGVLVRQLPR